MKAICFESIQRVSVQEIPDAAIEDTGDAIVKVSVAGLCGSDLHPFFGREIGIETGTVMGHEFVGEVVEVGPNTKRFRVGDRVCAPFTTNCGQCRPCKNGLTSRCVRGQLFGWREQSDGRGVSGLHGGQAEFVRVPMADTTLMRVPDGMSHELALLVGDNFSTGYFCAEMAGIQSDGVYVVLGCGTVGLMAIASAMRMGANKIIAIDPVESRLQVAHQMGAITSSDLDTARKFVAHATDGQGADAVLELVGLPDAQRMAIDIIRPGGTLAVIGCHCTPHFAFSPAEAYDKNLTYRTGRCPARHYMDVLSKSLRKEPIDLDWAVTHRFSIDDANEAYETFAHQKDGCLKAVIDFQ